jgi:hypothetical protein
VSTFRACYLAAALCCVAVCGSAQGLFTPDMAFEDNSFPRCISALSDSALVWEEQRIYGEEAPSRLEVEKCGSLSVSRTSFFHDEGEEDALRWTSTWVDWLEQMRDVGVEEAEVILDSWRQQGQPYVFDYCPQGDGGHCLHAEPGQFVIEFYAAW